MINLDKLEYRNKLVIDESAELVFSMDKTFFPDLDIDQYFVKVDKKLQSGNVAKAGYLYFCADIKNNESYFVGAYVNPKYRRQGLSPLMTSYWIKVCMDNDIDKLKTIAKQRKPFLLHTLKGFAFDLPDKSLYSEGHNIDIYLKDNSKHLYFENLEDKIDFLNSSIAANEKHSVIDELTEDSVKINTIILNHPYWLEDPNYAYAKSESNIKQLLKSRR